MSVKKRAMDSEQKIKFGHKLKTHFKEFNENTGIHGLRYVTENRSNLEKLFWIIVLLMSLGGCLIMITLTIAKFDKNPVVVSFANEDTSIYEIPFPAVTICPESKFSNKRFDYSDMFGRYDMNLSLNDDQKKKLKYLSLVCHGQNNDLLRLEEGDETVGDDFFDIINNLKPEDGIVCVFMNMTLPDCTQFLTPVFVDEGICYSFNIMDRQELYRNHVVHFQEFHRIGKTSINYSADSGYNKDTGMFTYPMRALVSGADNSFIIYFAHPINNTDYLCDNYLQGFRILLHYPGDIPRVQKSYFRVPLNKVVTAAIKPEQVVISKAVKLMIPEKRNCYLESERPLKHFKMYTQSNCLLECLANYTLRICGCVSYFMPRSNDTKVCGPGKRTCQRIAQGTLAIEELREEMSGSREKFCDCKAGCSHLDYNVEVSVTDFGKFFEEQNAGTFEGVVTDNREGYDMSVVEIYFKADHFIATQRNELYGTTDLISNFGGLLGLFTGFSLISVVEIVYFLTLRIFYNVRLFGRWWGA